MLLKSDKQTISYKNGKGTFETITTTEIVKKGICECCGRSADKDKIKTSIHHVAYDDEDKLKYTIELCQRCHVQYHRAGEGLGDLYRDKINKIAVEKWGEIKDEHVRKPERRRHKLAANQYKSGEKALTKKEYYKILSVIDNLADELLIKMAVTTGLRREDLCKVRICNINLNDDTLTFHESKKNTDRTIYLQPDVEILIKKYLNTQPKRDKLFPFSGRTAYRHLNHWCKIAEIPERPFHALRATCVKFCQAAGWKPEEVSKLTGDTIRVIQEHYATPSDGDMRQAVQGKPII